MFSVGALVQADFRYGSDLDLSVIALLKAIKSGWVPPTEISEAEYHRIKAEVPESDPLHGFVKYGCSFSGRGWQGYARSSNRNYASNAHHSLMRKTSLIKDCDFGYGDYRQQTYQVEVIYCDPPYKGRKKVGAQTNFNHEQFWDWVRERSETTVVLVSEYEAPEDFTCVYEKKMPRGLNATGAIERLFQLR
jgi:DNA adenine methylase